MKHNRIKYPTKSAGEQFWAWHGADSYDALCQLLKDRGEKRNYGTQPGIDQEGSSRKKASRHGVPFRVTTTELGQKAAHSL